MQTQGLYCSFEKRNSLFCTDLVPNQVFPGYISFLPLIPVSQPIQSGWSFSHLSHLNRLDEHRQNGNHCYGRPCQFSSLPKTASLRFDTSCLNSALSFPGPLYTNPSYQHFSGVIEWKYIHVGQLLEIQNTRNINKMKSDYNSF